MTTCCIRGGWDATPLCSSGDILRLLAEYSIVESIFVIEMEVGRKSNMETVAQIPQRVIERYSRDRAITQAEAGTHFAELQKFLQVCASSGGIHAPSRALDEIWHTFVLFTKDYGDFCLKRFGRFIHHEPTAVRMPTAYTRTREIAERMFGDLDPK